ncbi:MAG: BMP family ABC transporter substrate-binding protein [Solirubrobacterales bacterium]
MKRLLILFGLLAVGSALFAGCGGGGSSSSSSSSSSSTTGGGGSETTSADAPTINAMWTLGGPEKDGGYNEGAMIPSAEAPVEKFPGQVSVTFNPETTFDERATQILQQSVANGTNFYFDTQGLTTLVSPVCAENQELKCFLAGDPEKQGPNTRSWLPADWNLNYLAGITAGLTTKSGKVGIVVSYDVPVTKTVVNSFALGCQSVRPDCEVRTVYLENYFDPPKAAQATESLIDVGADVIRNYVDDPTFCKVAEERGVYAVGEFANFEKACPGSQLMATVWDLSGYVDEQTEEILDGTWKGGSHDIIEIGTEESVPHLEGWGSFVPAKVRSQVETVLDEIVAGKDVIVGPIYDQKGKLQYKEGEPVPLKVLGYEWEWFVRGVANAS